MKAYLCLTICVCAVLRLTESRVSLEALRPKLFKPTVISNGTGTSTAKVNVKDKPVAKHFAKSGRASPCGETLLDMKGGDHGYIESPGYPDPYKAGIECLWTFKVIRCNVERGVQMRCSFNH